MTGRGYGKSQQDLLPQEVVEVGVAEMGTMDTSSPRSTEGSEPVQMECPDAKGPSGAGLLEKPGAVNQCCE